MKTPFTLVLFVLFILNASAQIHTVNNIPGSAADYTDVQSAIDAAAAGDTIYVAGSHALYPNFNVTKSLTVFGSGYFLNEDEIPSKVGTISINASDSFIAGFIVENILLPTSSNTHNLTITDNHVTGYIDLRSGNGHKVEGNLFSRTDYNSIDFQYSSVVKATNVMVRNNIFYGRLHSLNSATSSVQNNVLIRTYNGDAITSSSDFSAINNIYFGYESKGCASCTHQFDLQYYYDSNTSSFVGSNPLFVNPATLPTSNTVVYDPIHDWSLQAGSPAIGVGQFGYDLGAYGGLTPFVPGGYPPIPRITSLTSPTSQIEEGGTVQITIQAVSQQ